MKKLLAAVVVAALAFIACQKEYSYETGNDATSTGAWEFKDSANTLITGNPVEYYIDDTTDPTAAHMVYSGVTASLSATLSIEVFFPTGTATTGTYTSAASQVNFLYQFSNGQYYKVDAFAGQTSTENISVSITAITDTSVTGTFSGTALTPLGRVVPIREGKFTYRKRSTPVTPVVPSVGTLGANADTSCTGAVLSGTYVRGVAMTGSNAVTITANITTPGTYTIYSDTLKGIHFTGTGTFTTTGVRTVVIPAIGTPTDSGITRFRIRYGNTICRFQVRIDTVASTTPPTGDYLPTTANSNWTYDNYEGNVFQDTTYILSTGTTRTIGVNNYSIFRVDMTDTLLYRKAAGIYYQAEDFDEYFGTGGVQQTRILQEAVAVNGTWIDSVNLTNLGIVTKIKVNYTLLEKAAAATITTTQGVISYQDVIKVRSVFTMSIAGTPTITFRTVDTWFARGKGIIYVRETDDSQVVTEARLRRSTIN